MILYTIFRFKVVFKKCVHIHVQCTNKKKKLKHDLTGYMLYGQMLRQLFFTIRLSRYPVKRPIRMLNWACWLIHVRIEKMSRLLIRLSRFSTDEMGRLARKIFTTLY